MDHSPKQTRGLLTERPSKAGTKSKSKLWAAAFPLPKSQFATRERPHCRQCHGFLLTLRLNSTTMPTVHLSVSFLGHSLLPAWQMPCNLSGIILRPWHVQLSTFDCLSLASTLFFACRRGLLITFNYMMTLISPQATMPEALSPSLKLHFVAGPCTSQGELDVNPRLDLESQIAMRLCLWCRCPHHKGRCRNWEPTKGGSRGNSSLRIHSRNYLVQGCS